MGLNTSKILSINPTNARLYFNNRFIGYARRQYNKERWETMKSRVCTYFHYTIDGLQMFCVTAASNVCTGDNQVRIAVNHGATHVFLSHDLFNKH